MSEQEIRSTLSSSLNRWKEEEGTLFSSWKREIEERLRDIENSEIPPALYFLQLSRGLLTEERVLVERDGRLGEEDWAFISQVQKTESQAGFLELDLDCESFALKTGMGKGMVLDAAIKTRVLSDNFQEDKPLFLELGEQQGGIRLIKEARLRAHPLEDGGFKMIIVDGYWLDYYSFFERNNVRLHSLIVDVLVETNCSSLFPVVLLFTSFVARKRMGELTDESQKDTSLGEN